MSLLVEQPTGLGVCQPAAIGVRHYPGHKYQHSEIPVDGYLRVPMSREEFLELDYEFGKAEWADGVAILMSPNTPIHGLIMSRIQSILFRDLREIDAIPEHWLFMDESIRRPDIVITAKVKNLASDWYLTAPLVVCEVLSPSTRRFDLGPKANEYLDFGIEQYWVVDPQAETIDVRVSVGQKWRSAVVVDAKNPEAEIAVGEHGVVRLIHSEIFG